MAGGLKVVSTAPVIGSSLTSRLVGWPLIEVKLPPANRLVPSVVRAQTWPFVLATNFETSEPSLMQNAARSARATVCPVGDTAWLNVPPT